MPLPAFLSRLLGSPPPLPATSANATRPNAAGKRVYHEYFTQPPIADGAPWKWSARVYRFEGPPLEEAGTAPTEHEAKYAAITWCERAKKEAMQ